MVQKVQPVDAKRKEDKQVLYQVNHFGEKIPNLHTMTRDPHRGMKKREECEICGEIV